MAKLVIAGAADCPYFAKVELLADSLERNLPDFKLHKIVKQPKEWQTWLFQTCESNGWQQMKSGPIIWRELVDRGGKGVLIGGANDFQEYAHGYYNIKSSFTSNDMTEVAGENFKVKCEIDVEEQERLAQSQPVHVGISAASSPIAYGLINALTKGEALGHDTELTLHLYDNSDNLGDVTGIELEAFDLASPLLCKTIVTSDPREAFAGCSVILLLDELVKGEQESQEEWLTRNHDHFVQHAKVINEVAPNDAKVILAGNGPVNFNACMMLQHVPDLQPNNIVAMSRLVENRAKGVLAERLKVNAADVVDVAVWGNVNGVHHIDTVRARVHNYDGAIWGPPSFSLPLQQMVHDDKWLGKEFAELVKVREAQLEEALQHRPSASHAAAIVSMLNHWWNGSPKEQTFSLAVLSEGWYGVDEGLVFSVPVTFSPKGSWTVVKDIVLSENDQRNIELCIKDLVSEKEVIYPPRKATPVSPTEEASPTAPSDDTSADVSEKVLQQDVATEDQDEPVSNSVDLPGTTDQLAPGEAGADEQDTESQSEHDTTNDNQ